MAILNYTTQIDSVKTLTEIQQILARHGAKKIIIDFSNDGNASPIALTFQIDWNGIPTAFSLPCNYVGVLKAMKKSSKVPSKLCTEAQALRVSWRIIKDWVESQMAMVEAEVAGLAEVFLPYAITKSGNTLYKDLESGSEKLLQSNR